MCLFAIGDLHLSGGGDKPMDVFGPQWDRHFLRISEDWRSRVGPEDTVLIPGDISWAMQLEDAAEDLRAIGELPGQKVLCKGNHDYWWNSLTRVRAILPPGMFVLQHDALDLGSCVVCGTRGWIIPAEGAPLTPENEKIYRREVARLRLALESAARIAAGRPVVAMLHYPPLTALEQRSGFTELLEEFGVQWAVYGHLHGSGIAQGFSGILRGVRYELVSCDSLNFTLRELPMDSGTSGGDQEAGAGGREMNAPEEQNASGDQNASEDRNASEGGNAV